MIAKIDSANKTGAKIVHEMFMEIIAGAEWAECESKEGMVSLIRGASWRLFAGTPQDGFKLCTVNRRWHMSDQEYMGRLVEQRL